MIDKNQIETWRSVQRKRIGPGGNGLAVLDAYQVEEVLTDYLAMREIVAAIAAEERVTTGLDGLPHCSTCGAGLSEQHRPNCWYTRAVAVIGPASERTGAE